MRRCSALSNCYTKSVSIHAPREGCDGTLIQRVAKIRRFNSRTPGGVRRRHPGGKLLTCAVSIHAPREGCDTLESFIRSLQLSVSIHAPREGCDRKGFPAIRGVQQFQFTHPGRGATALNTGESVDHIVSIHAPREGCDRRWRGGRLALTFQFTHPGRGATSVPARRATTDAVSIHAPREGCDS